MASTTTTNVGFGSLSTTASGSSSLGSTLFGVDVSTLITNLVDARKVTNTLRQDKIDANTAKLSAYSDFKTKLTALETAATALRNPRVTSGDADAFDAKQVLSTASGTIPASQLYAVSADNSAQTGSYSITINQVARKDTITGSMAIPDTSSAVYAAGGTLTINGTDITVGATTSLTQLKDLINDKTSTTKVSASVIQSGTSDYRLVLKSTETGKAITLTDSAAGAIKTALGVTESGATNDSLSAKIVLDGVPVTKSTNSIKDLISGVSIELYEADVGKPINLSVDNNLSGVSTAVADFITAYNDVIDYVQKQRAVGSDGSVTEDQVLHNDSLLASTYRGLQAAVAGGATGVASATLKSLRDVGIDVDQYNKLTVSDNTKFEDALLTKLDQVKALFGFAAPASSGMDVVDRPDSISGLVLGKVVTLTVSATDADGLPTAAKFTLDGVDYAATIENGFIKGAEGSPFEGFSVGYTGGVLASGATYTGTFTPTQGIADQMMAVLEPTLNETEGTLKQATDGLTSTNTHIQDQIDALTNQLEIYRNRLVLQFQAAQEAISMFESAQNSIKAFANSSSDS